MQTLGRKGFSGKLLMGNKPRSLTSMLNTNIFAVGAHAVQTFYTIATTKAYNEEFHSVFNELNTYRHNYQEQVNELLAGDSPVKDKLRNSGVGLAWKYEKAEIQMGGKGTSDWSQEHRQEILEKGKVRDAEGHHINNVSDHLVDQADPDNIRFARNKDEHLKMHDGDFKNTTTGDHIDRNKHLKQTNHHRVMKKEWTGIGLAALIGLGAGFTIGFAVKLAQSGLSLESIKIAAATGAKAGVESAFLGAINHVIVRGIGETATNALQGMAQNIGFTVTENLTRMCNMAVIGGMTILVFSVYQFCKLKLMGYGTKECLIRVGKSAAYSLTVLVLSIIAQGLWGGYAGIVVSVGIGFIVLIYKLGQTRYSKELIERIRLYSIRKYEPDFGAYR